jgi:hypothetical protein
MLIEEKTDFLKTPEYSFLKEIPNIMLLGFGGSYAYGTNVETSDIDVRGFYMNPSNEILGVAPDSEEFIDVKTDTVLYTFKKILKLFINCNPNTIELLGLRDYLYVTDAGQLILDNKELFLSKRAIYTFGQYANSQLNRLINKSGRGKNELIQNETRSLNKALASFKGRYKIYTDTGSIIKVSENNDEIFFDMNLKNVPINVIIQMLNELNAVHKDYSKSTRNDKAIEHNKLNKHMMHLLRLYMMGIDILEKGEIITYRENEHDLLMAIRNCEYLESDMKTPTKEFEKLIALYQERFNKAAANTKLPEKPDFDKINNLSSKIYKMYL